MSLNSDLERDELWLLWTSASQIPCYLTKIERKGCIQYDLNNISNLLKKRLEEERLPLGSGITRNSFCPASQYFSELHRTLTESLEDYYDRSWKEIKSFSRNTLKANSLTLMKFSPKPLKELKRKVCKRMGMCNLHPATRRNWRQAWRRWGQ